MTENNVAPDLKEFHPNVLSLTDDEIQKQLVKNTENIAQASATNNKSRVMNKTGHSEDVLKDILDDKDVLSSSKVHMTLRLLAKTYATMATSNQDPKKISQSAGRILENDNRMRSDFRKLLAKRAYEMQRASAIVLENIEKNNGHDLDKIISHDSIEKLETLLNALKLTK